MSTDFKNCKICKTGGGWHSDCVPDTPPTPKPDAREQALNEAFKGRCCCTHDLIHGFNAGDQYGQRVGEERVLALLRNGQAHENCIRETNGTGTFVSHDEWADWLEDKLKERR